MSLAAAYLIGIPRMPGSQCPDADPRVDFSLSDDPLQAVERELERLPHGATLFADGLEDLYQAERDTRRAERLPPWLRLWSLGQAGIGLGLLADIWPVVPSPTSVAVELLLALCVLAFPVSYLTRANRLAVASMAWATIGLVLQVALLALPAWSGEPVSPALLVAPPVALAFLCGAPLPDVWSRAAAGAFTLASILAALLVLPGASALTFGLGMAALWGAQGRIRERLASLCRETFLLRRQVRLQNEASRAERAAMERLAKVDALTGIPNRRAFDAQLIEHLVRARPSRPVCVALLDIDYFKALNDTAGHLSGDECLRRVAGALRKAAGDALVARYGGEEFAVLFEADEKQALSERLERLREAVLALDIAHPGRRGERLTISLGAATATEAENSRVVLDRADTALYRAKNEGRNRVAFEPKAMPVADTADLRRLLDLARDGRGAQPAEGEGRAQA